MKVALAATPTLSAPRKPAEGGRLQLALQSGTRQGADWGDKLELGVGGMTGLALTAVATYGMVFGGAVVGTMLGAGLGPVVASLASNGAWGFVTTTLTTAGTAAKAGMILGGVAGTLGAFGLGTKIGGTLAKGVGFGAGFVVGGAKGLAGIEVPGVEGDKEAPEPRQTGPMFHGAFRPAARMVAGAAAVSGGVGGFVGGATLAAAGSLAQTALSSSLTWGTFVSSLPATALIGGAIGAVALAYIGGKGGLQIVQGAQWAWDKTGGKIELGNKTPTGQLKEREKTLAERETALTDRAARLEQDREKAKLDQAGKASELERREQDLNAQEQALKSVPVDQVAQSTYEAKSGQPDPSLDAGGPHPVMGERHALRQWQSKLDNYQDRVNRYEGELKKS